MAKPASLARTSLVTEVQDAIKDLIYERHLKPGDPLPTEHELAETLGVSRNSLREALKVLEATGVVVIRRGFGMAVGEMSLRALISELVFHARLSAQEGTKELRDLMDLRASLEGALIVRAMESMKRDDLDKIDAAVVAMERAASEGRFSPPDDRVFHELLYRPLDNPFISQLLAAFWDVFDLLQDHLPRSIQTPAEIAAQHREIYEALLREDGEAAANALQAHFKGIEQRLDRDAEPVAEVG
ncbi:FadR/GntR family transcriptional regulator [Humibacter sp.]|jgi:DNA-binding FadR family transcriptional regulator|uniref:FadR/GntR family transcriptional regulator n=1 Tax=Humibacter sp. TaxID=1940291 RepID=UPI003F806E6D